MRINVFIIKFPVSKRVTFDIFDEFVSYFKFGIRIRKNNCIDDVFLTMTKGSSSSFKSMIEFRESILNKSKELFSALFLQVNK